MTRSSAVFTVTSQLAPAHKVRVTKRAWQVPGERTVIPLEQETLWKPTRYPDYSVNALPRIHKRTQGKSPQEKHFSPQLFSITSSVMPDLQLMLPGERAKPGLLV